MGNVSATVQSMLNEKPNPYTVYDQFTNTAENEKEEKVDSIPAPFPFKIAKALDPNIYRNIEYDTWIEVRKGTSCPVFLCFAYISQAIKFLSFSRYSLRRLVSRRCSTDTWHKVHRKVRWWRPWVLHTDEEGHQRMWGVHTKVGSEDRGRLCDVEARGGREAMAHALPGEQEAFCN